MWIVDMGRSEVAHKIHRKRRYARYCRPWSVWHSSTHRREEGSQRELEAEVWCKEVLGINFI
jgi:hypothetical protein